MENPLNWGPVEKKIYEAKRAWDESNADGVVGYSYPAYIAIELRKAGLLRETSIEDLLSMEPEAVAEYGLRDAIARLLSECNSEQREFFGRRYPNLWLYELSEAYELLVRNILDNRNATENT